jgi:hypothetical protein
LTYGDSITYPHISNPFTRQQSYDQPVLPKQYEDIQQALQQIQFQRELSPQHPIQIDSIANPGVGYLRVTQAMLPMEPLSDTFNNTLSTPPDRQLNSLISEAHTNFVKVRLTGESFWCRKILMVVISAELMKKKNSGKSSFKDKLTKPGKPDVFFIFNSDGSIASFTSSVQIDTRKPTWNESIDM